jgi:16S rRNA (cytosine967-C5)-methyltransferase
VTPGARIAAAIDILEALAAGTRPADDVAADYFRRRRYIGSKDRAQVARHVYSVLRHRAALDWWVTRAGKGEIGVAPRSRMMAALAIAEGEPEAEITASFDGGKFRPAALAPAEEKLVQGLAGRTLRHPAMPRAVANDLPDWLLPHLEAVYGDRLEEEMAGLNSAAPVDLRVNLLKTDRAGAIGALAAEGVRAEPTPYSPTGLRLTERVPLSGLAAFKDGLVEVQDEASQLAALLLGAKPGMRVVDFCAGAGGKTLALAAAMKNRGKIVACDTAGWRLDRSGQRLRRAGASNVERHALASERDPWVKRHAKSFDRVLVDAPCLGVGSWRRNPDAKWRATPQDLAELQVRQHDILASAARLVKPSGRLAYVTCSLLIEENEAQAERFLAETPDFALVPVAEAWEEAIGTPCPAAIGAGGDDLRLTPAQHGTDGFFVALFERNATTVIPGQLEELDPEPMTTDGAALG